MQQDYLKICAATRSNFSKAIDLVIIHNERPVSGPQPRSTLNPLTVLLAVAAWERFIAELDALEAGKWTGTGLQKSKQGGAYLWNNDEQEPGPAASMLAEVTNRVLPAAWRLRNFTKWRGAAPTHPRDLDGGDLAAVAEAVDSAIRLRNSVAHQCLPQDERDGPLYWSDAKSHTIQAGWARLVLALFLQLTNQTMATVASAAGYPTDARFQLPRAWFTAAPPNGFRGTDNPGSLWAGHALHY